MTFSRQVSVQKLNVIVAQFIIKHIVVFVIFFSAILLILITWFLALPLYENYNLIKNIEIPKLEMEKIKENQNLEVIKQEYQKEQSRLIELKLDELDSLVAKSSDKVDLYLPIQKLIRDADFELLSISIVDNGISQFGQKQMNKNLSEESNLSLGEFTINLALLGGDYAELKKLLKRFEKSTPLFDVLTVTFNPSSYKADAKEERQGVSYNIVLKAYYLDTDKQKTNKNE